MLYYLIQWISIHGLDESGIKAKCRRSSIQVGQIQPSGFMKQALWSQKVRSNPSRERA